MSATAQVVVETTAVDFCPRQLVAQRVIHENKFSARTLPAVKPFAGLILSAARVLRAYVCAVCTSKGRTVFLDSHLHAETVFVIVG